MKLKILNAFLIAVSISHGSWELKSWDNTGFTAEWKKSSYSFNPAVPDCFTAAVPSGAGLEHKIINLQKTKIPAGSLSSGLKEVPLRGDVLLTRAAGRFRDVEIAAVEFKPLYRVNNDVFEVQSLVADFTFNTSGASWSSPARSSFAPSAKDPAEQYLKSLLINYNQSRSYRTIVPAVVLRKTASINLPVQRLIIKTGDESIYRLHYEKLKKAGVPVDKIDPREMKLFHGQFELPMFISGEVDGEWDPGDYLEFTGRRPSGSRMEGDQISYNSFYTNTASLILVWNMGTKGLRAPLTPVSGAQRSLFEDYTKTSAGPYKVFRHLEKDLETVKLGGVAVSEILDLGPGIALKGIADFWMWTRQGSSTDAVHVDFVLENKPAEIKGLTDDQKLFITIRMQGITDVSTAQFDHHIRFLINDVDISTIKGSDNTAKWAGDEPYLWRSGPLDPGLLKLGKNILTIQKINDLLTASGDEVENQDAYLDYIELEYLADHQVFDNKIHFNHDFSLDTGNTKIVLGGIEGESFSLWDKQGRKLTGYKISGSGNTLTFSDIGVAKTGYVLCSEENIVTPDIHLDTLMDLRSTLNQADYIIITQKELAGKALDSLISQKEDNGLNCMTVFADHIYQEFGDGAVDPAYIRDFISFAYHHWQRPAPSYVLLLGETSMWFDKKSGAAQKNIVPTHLVHIPGWGVTSNDDYFAKVSGNDNIADLFIGRIPVSSRRGLSRVVKKIIRHENSRNPGHWNNKVFLIGGVESVFTKTNDKLQNMAVKQGRQFSRVDVDKESPYYRGRPIIYPQLDSSLNIVSFSGHGGGSVWSDGNILTLNALDNDSLKGDFSIPLVFSMTCLTGFFEDVADRSLGEEMLRRETSGAAAFYGASGYTSNVAGELISQELFKTALEGGSRTVGSIINRAETITSLRTGSMFTPILAEFDLLGDPAMRIDFPAVANDLIVNNSIDDNDINMTIKGKQLKLNNASGVVSIFMNDSTVFTSEITITNSAFTLPVTLSSDPEFLTSVAGGKVVAHYWNDNGSFVSQGEFSVLDWMITSLAINPVKPNVGDDVRLSFSLSPVGDSVRFFGGSAVYYIGDDEPVDFPVGRESRLESNEVNVFRTVGRFSTNLDGSYTSNPKLYVRMRMSLEIIESDGSVVSLAGIESKVYSFDLQTPSDLVFPSQPFAVPIQNKLGTYVRFLNRGLGTDSAFWIILEKDVNGPGNSADTIIYNKSLQYNQLDSVFFRVLGKEFNTGLRAVLVSVIPNRETNLSNNQADTVFANRTLLLRGPEDSLTLGNGLYIAGSAPEGTRVFADIKAVDLPVPSHLKLYEPGNGSPAIFKLESDTSGKSWAHTIGYQSPELKSQKKSTGPYWHYFLEATQNWLKIDTVKAENENELLGQFFWSGYYGMFFNSDMVQPRVDISSGGQYLLQDDYVPQGHPIEITVRDNAGIDFFNHVPQLDFMSDSYDSRETLIKQSAPSGKTGIIKFQPKSKNKVDSISMSVWDISGNRFETGFKWKYGRGFKVQVFGNYPNPFADTTVFVYQLTDLAEEVRLRVYSRAGRLVWSHSEKNVNGYREVVWSGESNSGRDVANGLYFLKVMAKQGDEESSGTFKLFKKKRK